MLDCLIGGRETLKEKLNLEKDIWKMVLDNDVFWVRVSSILAILKPIVSAIQEIEQGITSALPPPPLLKLKGASITNI